MNANLSREEQQLLKELDNYRGEWVAVQDHKVVGHAEKLGDLVEDMRASEYENATAFKVAEDPHISCFF